MTASLFQNARILVVGDILLDTYFHGDVERISPEAPVPVVRVTSIRSNLGGAANVAHNIARLGARSMLIGVTGDDENGAILQHLCVEAGIDFYPVKGLQPTINKCRIVSGNQQMLRLDFETTAAPGSPSGKQIGMRITQRIPSAGALILSDYAKGLCTSRICRRVIGGARESNIPIIVDPKSEDWTMYANATYITPNLKELRAAYGRSIPNEDKAVTVCARKLLKQYEVRNILVTRSEKGMSLISLKKAIHIHSRAREVFDVSGAGDTVVATLGTALAAGYDPYHAVELANIAAGIVVGRAGTVPVDYDELQREAAAFAGASTPRHTTNTTRR